MIVVKWSRTAVRSARWIGIPSRIAKNGHRHSCVMPPASRPTYLRVYSWTSESTAAVIPQHCPKCRTHGQRRRSTLVTTGSLGTHRWCVDAEECAQPQEGAPDPKQAAPCKSPEPGLASTCASREKQQCAQRFFAVVTLSVSVPVVVFGRLRLSWLTIVCLALKNAASQVAQ